MSSKRSISTVKANVSYRFIVADDTSGARGPIELGQGKFAKVLKAEQQSDGHDGRPVAIKILHDFATSTHEQLFHQEIELLKGMSAADVNVVSTLDVLYLEPMVMCGCGNVYHPACPRGCGEELVRDEPRADEINPALLCTKCGYRLSGRFVSEQFWELLQYPAKLCCLQGPNEKIGTLLNFVDRNAIVMELFELKLPDFLEHRRSRFHELASRYCASPKAPAPSARQGDSWHRRALRLFTNLWNQDRSDVLLSKAILLEKVRLMVELAEAVDWLHGEKRIVHKDLAPDNLMVSFVGSDDVDWVSFVGHQDADRKGRDPGILHEALSRAVSSPRFHLHVIDFGLSDKDQLTRSWYEEETGSGLKQPFLSPEARFIRQRIGLQLELGDGYFLVPPTLAKKLMQTDIVADLRDPNHNHDLTITKIEERDPGDIIAYFDGTPPLNLRNQLFELVYRPGEAHDLYAVGALYYYILTEQQDEVEKLGGFITSMPDGGLALDAAVLGQDDRYRTRRNAIREKFWQDELMVLILSAMVRGQPGSLKEHRIDRDPAATRRLLDRTKQIHHGIQREILAAPEMGPLYRAAIVACLALAGVALMILLGLLLSVLV